MAGAAAAVRDDGARTLHHRLPVGVGHVGDEHVARLHAVHFSSALNDADFALADLLTDGAALREEAALGAERILDLDLNALLLRLHRFRTSLKDVDLAVGAVLAPFDVHRAAVVLLDDAGELREFDHVVVGDCELAAVFLRNINRTDRAARRSVGFKFHADQLRAERLADDRELAFVEGGLEDVELVRVHRALHDRLAEAVRSRDEDHLVEARFRIEREHHAGSALVGAAHALNARGKRDLSVREALVDAVRNGTVVVEGSKDFLHVAENGVNAVHVEHGFLLAGKGSIRQVLSGGR